MKSAISCASQEAHGLFTTIFMVMIDDDEAGYRFGDHAFITGEYISIREHDEDMNTFRIVSVTPVS